MHYQRDALADSSREDPESRTPFSPGTRKNQLGLGPVDAHYQPLGAQHALPHACSPLHAPDPHGAAYRPSARHAHLSRLRRLHVCRAESRRSGPTALVCCSRVAPGGPVQRQPRLHPIHLERSRRRCDPCRPDSSRHPEQCADGRVPRQIRQAVHHGGQSVPQPWPCPSRSDWSEPADECAPSVGAHVPALPPRPVRGRGALRQGPGQRHQWTRLPGCTPGHDLPCRLRLLHGSLEGLRRRNRRRA